MGARSGSGTGHNWPRNSIQQTSSGMADDSEAGSWQTSVEWWPCSARARFPVSLGAAKRREQTMSLVSRTPPTPLYLNASFSCPNLCVISPPSQLLFLAPHSVGCATQYSTGAQFCSDLLLTGGHVLPVTK